MRVLSFLVLVVIAAVVGLFAYQNKDLVTLHFLQWGISATLAQFVGAIYLLGMLTGWSVIGLFRRSLRRVTYAPRQYARS